MTVVINGKRLSVEANAFTLIVYEDRFKGRRLLQDATALLRMTDTEDISFGLVARLLWAELKTADDATPDFYDWLREFSVADVMEARLPVLEVLAESMITSKKLKAAARRAGIFRRFSSWLTRRSAD